jgi:hypothetical protein
MVPIGFEDLVDGHVFMLVPKLLKCINSFNLAAIKMK